MRYSQDGVGALRGNKPQRSSRPLRLSKKSEKEGKVIPAKAGIYSNVLISIFE